jgi:hypothetical protein
MPLVCQNCGSNAFRLRRVPGGPEAQCIKCGTIIPNTALRAVHALGGPATDPGTLNQIQLAAQEMTRLHGTDAARQAAKRAGDALVAGDINATQFWLSVIGSLVKGNRTDER